MNDGGEREWGVDWQREKWLGFYFTWVGQKRERERGAEGWWPGAESTNCG